MKNLHKRYKRFREWEKQPHQVAPLSEEHHECATCGTHYEGNYCPRCGQSARIGRYSFKNALLLYLDVWGLGNRGMFRSIRDLILRPAIPDLRLSECFVAMVYINYGYHLSDHPFAAVL